MEAERVFCDECGDEMHLDPSCDYLECECGNTMPALDADEEAFMEQHYGGPGGL